ncbi:MAG: phosphopyruvate hydratase, partial [Candidatus Babeliales bacterium]
VCASVPAGASCGTHEAVELRDGGNRLEGLGVLKSIDIIENKIAPMLIGKEPNVVQMDIMLLELDNTPNKSKLGANTMLAVSIAICKAQALAESLELYELIAYICSFELVALPCPLINILNGGLHADNNFSVQEIMIMPLNQPSFRSALEVGFTIFHGLKKLLHKQGKLTAIGDEGGFAPIFTDLQQALNLVMEAIEQYGNGNPVMIALDIASSHFYDQKTDTYLWYGKQINKQELIEIYQQLTTKYPIYSIEDGLTETDWNGWEQLNELLGSQAKIIGDDIFATNPERIWHGIEEDTAQGAIIKPNQIGTVTETLQAAKLCKEYNWDVIVSHRSGETNDSFIADLAVGISAEQMKAGGCTRGERMAKYNRLLKIEDQLMMKSE